MSEYMVKGSPQYELRELIFSLLDDKMAYGGEIVPVYESVPIGDPMPWVVIGLAEWVPDEAKHYNIDEYKIHVDVYTQFGGTLQNVAILDSVYRLLSAALNDGNMQFPEESVYRVGVFLFDGGRTEVVGNNNVFPNLLEQSSLELLFKIEQTR